MPQEPSRRVPAVYHLRLPSLTLVAGVALLAAGRLFAADPIAPQGPVALFNGRDLAGWVPFAGEASPPPAETWQVADGVIKCSGRPNGYLRTAARHRDFRLTVEWRWVPGPAPVNAEGRPRPRNSGVLLHMQGEDAVWPRSLEAQLMEGNAGDFYVIGGVETAELLAAREVALAAAGADEQAAARARNNRRVAKMAASSEKPVGEWNTYSIVCRGDTVTVRVNGVEQNRATGVTVREGHICLQSEGAPIEFRNVRLDPLD